jgi:hypothetical protein
MSVDGQPPHLIETHSIKGLFVTLSTNDTQRDDIQHSDIQHKDTKHNATQGNGKEHDDTQHKGIICNTQHKRHPA